MDTEESIRSLIKASAGISLLRAEDADKAEQEGWGVRWHGRTPKIPLAVAVQQRRVNEPLIQAWHEVLAKCWHLDQGKVKQNAI